MNRILAIGALLIVLAQLGGCLALLLSDRPTPEWLTHSTVASVAAVVSVIATLRAVKPKA